MNTQTAVIEFIVKNQDALKSLNTFSKALGDISKEAGKLGSAADLGLGKLSADMVKTSKSTGTLSGSIKKLSYSLAGILSIRSLSRLFVQSSVEAMNYTETLNLFTTALGESKKEGIKFQNQMNDTFGVNMEEMMKYEGLFTGIANSLGLGTEESYKLGKSLSMLSVDLSSLYNRDIKQVNEALKSGMVGQTKPVRSLGMDITEKTLQNELLLMGIHDKTIATMSQTEKVIMRYNVMLKQSGIAHGDWAKTIESPANQMRILRNQLIEIKRWIGATFYSAIASVLPYINGFAMAIKEVIKALALVFGFKSQTFGGAMYEDTGIEELGSGISDADKKAKKLKAQLMGFDEINNISTQDDNSGSGSGGAATGVDPRLLASMKEYESTMENVRMKATTIRDRIMDWLGYTKVVNEETGAVTFELDKGYQKIEMIRDAIKGLLGLFLMIKTVKFINNMVKDFKLLKDFFGKIFALTLKLKKYVVMLLGQAYAFLQGIAAMLGITVGWLIAIIAAIVVLTVLIVKFRKEIWDFLKNVGSYIAEAFNSSIEFIVSTFTQIKDWFVGTGVAIYDFFKGIFDAIYGFIAPIFKWIYSTIIEPIVKAFTKAFTFIYDIVSTVVTNVIKVLSKIIEIFLKIGEIVFAVGNYIFSIVYDFIIQPFIDGLVFIIKFLGDLAKSTYEIFATIVKFIYDKVISPVFKFFKDVFVSIYNEVAGFVANFIAIFSTIATFIYDKVVKPVFKFFKGLLEDIINIFVSVGTAVADSVSWIIKKALNTVFGLIEGIVNTFLKALNGAIKLINKIPGVEITKVKELKIERFADGGFPQVGSMFIAREAGPEMVGSINGNVAVANNDQIVQAVSQGVAQAVSRVMGSGGQSFAFYLDGEKMTNTVVQKINNQIQQYGTSPLRG